MEKTCPNCWLDFEKNGAWSRLLDNQGHCPECGERMPATATYCNVIRSVSACEPVRRVREIVRHNATPGSAYY